MYRFSVIVPTKDRPKDLAELLQDIIDQSYHVFEVIVVDNSSSGSAQQAINSFRSKFSSKACRLRYVQGGYEGLSNARNFGVKLAHGDVVLFLDDDTLLDKFAIHELATFLLDTPSALGVQPRILTIETGTRHSQSVKKFADIISKAFMLSYHEKNRLGVRRSGASILTGELTKAIPAQRLHGCCCYRREVFKTFRFDAKLKRWGYMEDLDFSYRIFKKYRGYLYVIPRAVVVHKSSNEARLPRQLEVYMRTTYWFYVFFKDFFQSSMLNLIAFLWSLVGTLVFAVGRLVVERQPSQQRWQFIFLARSQIFALRHLSPIIRGELGFFDKLLITKIHSH